MVIPAGGSKQRSRISPRHDVQAKGCLVERCRLLQISSASQASLTDRLHSLMNNLTVLIDDRQSTDAMEIQTAK
jgi:hypothetical protein